MSALVSILIPAYNAAPWLRDTLDSALAQREVPIEVIVVDDGSRDDTLTIARTYENRGVQVYTQANAGAAAARNTALRHARGDFIQYLDADDLLHPDKLRLQLALLADSPKDTLVSGTWGRFETSPQEARFPEELSYRDSSALEFLRRHFETGAMMQPAAWLTPRNLIDKAGPWNTELSLNDDGEYFARVMLASSGIRFCREALCYYRSGISGSLSQSSSPRALRSLHRSIELITGLMSDADPSPATRSACAAAWKWLAFDLYPAAPELSADAMARCRALGGSHRPFPGSGRFKLLAKLLGWRLARRLTARR